MGAKLSIINDIEATCTVEVWTNGQIILQSLGTVDPRQTYVVKHAATWYDVVFKIWRLGSQEIQVQRVLLGSETTTIKLSMIYGPGKRGSGDSGFNTPGDSDTDEQKDYT